MPLFGLHALHLRAFLFLFPWVLYAAPGRAPDFHLSPVSQELNLSVSPPSPTDPTKLQQTPSRFPLPLESGCGGVILRTLPYTACISAIETLHYWSGPDHPLIYFGNNPKRAKPGVYMVQKAGPLYPGPQFLAYDMDRRGCQISITGYTWPTEHYGPRPPDDRFVIMDLEYMAVQLHRMLLRCERGGHVVTLPNLDPRLHGHTTQVRLEMVAYPALIGLDGVETGINSSTGSNTS